MALNHRFVDYFFIAVRIIKLKLKSISLLLFKQWCCSGIFDLTRSWEILLQLLEGFFMISAVGCQLLDWLLSHMVSYKKISFIPTNFYWGKFWLVNESSHVIGQIFSTMEPIRTLQVSKINMSSKMEYLGKLIS